MKRVNIFYGGLPYSIGHRSVDDVQAEVDAALDAGRGWLVANYGEGTVQEARLLITPGTDITLVGVDVPDDES